MTTQEIEDIIRRTESTSFGPYFAIKVMSRIQNVGIQIDRQISIFFKKYQLAVIGIVIGLLAINVVFADQLNLETIFGLDGSEQAGDEIVSFDFSKILNQDI